MERRSVFTSITPLPPQVARSSVIETLHNHTRIIDLNPLVIERHKIDPPAHAAPEELDLIWYEITDRLTYIPGLSKGKVTYTNCFLDLPDGLQTHSYAAAGVNIRGRWTIGGSIPGEPSQPAETGEDIPTSGLYLREDVDLRCNALLLFFVRRTMKSAHKIFVDRLVTKAQQADVANQNDRPVVASPSIGPSLHGGSPSDDDQVQNFTQPPQASATDNLERSVH